MTHQDPPLIVWIVLAAVVIALACVILWAMDQPPPGDE